VTDESSSQIVPEASAVYDGYNVRRESIDANHSTMVKFETSAVLGYTRIVSHIQRMLRKKRTQQLAQQGQPLHSSITPGKTLTSPKPPSSEHKGTSSEGSTSLFDVE